MFYVLSQNFFIRVVGLMDATTLNRATVERLLRELAAQTVPSLEGAFAKLEVCAHLFGVFDDLDVRDDCHACDYRQLERLAHVRRPGWEKSVAVGGGGIAKKKQKVVTVRRLTRKLVQETTPVGQEGVIRDVRPGTLEASDCCSFCFVAESLVENSLWAPCWSRMLLEGLSVRTSR
jgi:hypothetical protein